MIALDLSTRLKQSARQVSCNLNEEVAILDLEKSVYFGLEGVGAHVWHALEQPRSVDEICRSVVGAFDVAEPQCRSDVLQFLSRLEAMGLVEVVGDAA